VDLRDYFFSGGVRRGMRFCRVEQSMSVARRLWRVSGFFALVIQQSVIWR
jgi:hypothetical protein